MPARRENPTHNAINQSIIRTMKYEDIVFILRVDDEPIAPYWAQQWVRTVVDIGRRVVFTLLGPQSRFGDKRLECDCRSKRVNSAGDPLLFAGYFEGEVFRARNSLGCPTLAVSLDTLSLFPPPNTACLSTLQGMRLIPDVLNNVSRCTPRQW